MFTEDNQQNKILAIMVGGGAQIVDYRYGNSNLQICRWNHFYDMYQE